MKFQSGNNNGKISIFITYDSQVTLASEWRGYVCMYIGTNRIVHRETKQF